MKYIVDAEQRFTFQFELFRRLRVKSEPIKPIWRALILLGLSFGLPTSGVSDIQTITQQLTADISSYGKVSLPANVSLRSGNTRFAMLSGSVAVSYWARTSAAGGGSITVQANSDFSPAGGPSITDVSYACSGATLGAQCSGNQDLSASMQGSLVLLPANSCTGGGGVCSTQDPNTVLITLSAPSKPAYKTGSYSAQITLTISTL